MGLSFEDMNPVALALVFICLVAGSYFLWQPIMLYIRILKGCLGYLTAFLVYFFELKQIEERKKVWGEGEG